MKKSIKYISLVGVFIILIFSITITNLLLKYDETGSFVYNKEYYEIRFNNVKINYDIDAVIKTNDKDKNLHFELSNINDYIEEKEFYVDLTNLGNQDVVITDIYYSNFDTSDENEKIDIVTNLQKEDRIDGGSSKRLVVKIKNNNKKTKDIKHYSFNINFKFDKVSF